MDDIATLGLAVDSRQVVTAKDALTGLASAAKNASGASKDLTDRTKDLSDKTKDTANAHKGLSTQAMSAQHSLRSMVEAIASGQPITQVFAQQLNHLSYAATGPTGLTGAFKEAAGALTGLISPTALVVTGIAGVAAAYTAAVVSLAKAEVQFDDTARSVDTTVTSLHELAQAASFKGIDNKDFLDAMTKFGDSVYNAQNHMGGLVDVFRANNVQASNFDDYLAKAADIIKNATSDQQRLQLLQQMGLPATIQWVDLLRQGSAGLTDARLAAVGFGSDADKNLIAKAKEFDEAWNKATTNIGQYLKSTTLTSYDWLSKAAVIVSAIAKINNAFTVPTRVNSDRSNAEPNPYSAGQPQFIGPTKPAVPGEQTFIGPTKPAGTSVDPNVEKNNIARLQQQIGLLGQLATSEDAVRQVQLARQAAAANGVYITDAQEKALENLAREQSNGVATIKASIDAQNVEATTVGMSIGQAAEYTAKLNAMNAAKQQGRKLYASDIDQIKQEASALGQAAQNADLMKFAYTGFVQGPMQAFQQSLSQNAKFFDALKAAGMSALNALSSKLADMAAQNLWKAALGGSSGSLAGVIGALTGSGPSIGETSAVAGASSGMMGGVSFPIIGAGVNHTGFGPGDSFPTRFVHPAYFDDAPRFHSGIGPGERAAIIRTDESVLTPGQMKALGKSSGDGAVTVNMPVYNTFNGADPGSEARIRAYVDQSSKAAVQTAVQQVSTIKSTTPSYLKSGR